MGLDVSTGLVIKSLTKQYKNEQNLSTYSLKTESV